MPTDPVILHLETATTSCSVAVSRGTSLLGLKELDAGYTHAENLHVFIREVLQQAGLKTQDLEAVALSAGPGSYTGLRIGSSTAKGLCFALKIPMITVGTLKLLAWRMKESVPSAQLYCPMIDAGRMEVYTAIFDRSLSEYRPVQPVILSEETLREFDSTGPIVFGGSGLTKGRELLSRINSARFLEDLRPSARYLPALAMEAWNGRIFVQPADFEPFYLKSFIAGKKKAG